MISAYVIPGLKYRAKIRKEKIQPDYIIETVCDFYNEATEFVQITCRKRMNVKLRYICFLLLRKKTDLSLKSIGALFNKRYDHTTVLHGIQTLNNWCDCYPDIQDDLYEIEKKLNT